MHLCICVYVFVHLWVCTVYVSAFVCVGTITDGDGGKTRDGVTLVPAGNGSPPETFQIHPLFAFSQVHLLLSISVHFPRPFFKPTFASLSPDYQLNTYADIKLNPQNRLTKLSWQCF